MIQICVRINNVGWRALILILWSGGGLPLLVDYTRCANDGGISTYQYGEYWHCVANLGISVFIYSPGDLQRF